MQTDLTDILALTQFRAMEPGEERFVFNSWLKSYRLTAAKVDTELYYLQHHKLVDSVLRRSAVIVAAGVEDRTQILGYVVFQNMSGVTGIHYIYVKAPFRNLGLATALLTRACAGASAVHHSHETSDSLALVKSFKSIFNPYLAH